MALTDLINVVVNLQAQGLTSPGFGIDLILSNTGKAWATPELTRTYNSLASVAVDFPTTTAEYGAAAALFGQSPAPTTVMVGKGPTKPTMVQVISILTVISTAGSVYKINVFCKGVLQTASFTTVGSDTNDSIVTGLVAAITALATPTLNFGAAATGSGGSHVITCTGTAAGDWFSLEPVASGDPAAVSNMMALLETSTDPGVATDLTAIANASAAWYALTLLHKSPAIVTTAVSGVAAWTEANGKFLAVAPVDTVCATAAYALNGADICNKVKDGSYSRTHAIYHPRSYEFVDAAKDGKFLPINPGNQNWRMKSYAGATAVNYTPTQIVNLKAKNAGFYYLLGATSNGIAVDGGDGKNGSGEYTDVLVFLDWLVANISTDFVNLDYSVTKIPFTDAGVALIENLIRKWMAAGIAAGGINPFPAPTVTSPKVVDIPTGDKTARWLGQTAGYGTVVTFTLAGAINKQTVNLYVLQ